MTTHVALLRAVNVGGRTVKKDELVAAFDAMGLPGAWTFLASGNVVFEAPPADDLPERITAGLGRALGFEVPTFVRTAQRFQHAAAHDPFDGWGQRYVGFAAEPLPSTALEALATVPADDRFALDGAELHWSTPGKLSESPFFKKDVEKLIGIALTVRKGTTLARLSKKLEAA